MKGYSLTHLSDQALLSDLGALVAQDRATTAATLAHIAEVDARRLYAPAGYPSMLHYCVGQLRFSEDAAGKRIHAARAARQFPEIFPALAEGRLHLSAVVMLAPHLKQANAADLLASATHRTKSQIELLLAERFPKADVPSFVRPIASGPPVGQSSELQAGMLLSPPAPTAPCESGLQHAPGRVPIAPAQVAPGQSAQPTLRAMIKPLAPQRFALQATLGKSAHDKLRYIQALLGHALPANDIEGLLERCFDEMIRKLEQRKFGANARSRPMRRRRSTNERCVSATVRREVWERDQGKCTFVSDSGHPCESCTRLEFDHVQPVARGGLSTANNLRLRCRAHNQYTAERTFGAGFMEDKRQAARAKLVRT